MVLSCLTIKHLNVVDHHISVMGGCHGGPPFDRNASMQLNVFVQGSPHLHSPCAPALSFVLLSGTRGSQARRGRSFRQSAFWVLSCSQTLALSRARSITPKLIGRISGHDPPMHLALSDPSIRRKRHKSAMSIVMKMNDSLGMSKAADVDILLPSDRNLPAGKNTQLRRGRKETVAPATAFRGRGERDHTPTVPLPMRPHLNNLPV